ncbi:MAG: STAS domain-containing protein [Planctomycetes bacterium]|nr:STAS domain-containing protein [Planctomycetota bacterium]MCB9909244.1 STAS domain-containing protein [Planctomycetota bacterium]HPF13478.1 STAS domain-containing protein [Planctomycetota bacterium]HRV81829.1 STAS domain-containing protein [Planctomycetota bacterium]
MHISVEPIGPTTILHLRGEFDTFYCSLLEKEVQAALDKGARNVVLNLRLVKYINSTALGSILKVSKQVQTGGGTLGISSPSPFCRDILGKVGLDRIVPSFESDEVALESINAGQASAAKGGSGELELDPASLIFRPLDPERIDHFLEQAKSYNPLHGHAFGKNWSGVGRMAALSPQALSFTWAGGNTGLSPFEMGQLLAVGTDLNVKFRLPLLQRGFCEAQVTVTDVEERTQGVKLACNFKSIDSETESAIRQYAQDLDFLRTELRKATDS